jgi:hypothetical protein
MQTLRQKGGEDHPPRSDLARLSGTEQKGAIAQQSGASVEEMPRHGRPARSDRIDVTWIHST